MKKIDKPTFKVADVLKSCLENMTNQELKEELLNSSDVFTQHETDFDNKTMSHTTHLIQQDLSISETANAKELKKLYTDRLVNKDNKSRKYYNNLFFSTSNEKCPICSQRIVKTLDHYLPKSKFPILSIVPYNLVPACSDCNKGKSNEVPDSSEKEPLHPYYDDIESFSWLKARIVEIKPIVIQYFVSPPNEWSQLLKNRVFNHFLSYELNSLFSKHAAEEFENINLQLTKLYMKGGKELLQKHLNDCYQSRLESSINSWQTAFYECLLNDDSFLNGSFI